MNYTAPLLASFLMLISVPVFAAETTMGQAVEKNGMEIGGVYLQPIQMECAPGMKQDATNYDIHLETDIHALQNNPNGFSYGEWIPYLTISYHLIKEGTQWEQSGDLMPMVANDGPHYGRNIKLDGTGKYKVTFHIEPPNVAGFCRHTDKETGVSPWWSAFDVTWEFTYLGTGKSGGY